MATKTAFPQEVMAALKSQTKFINQSKKATDAFASFAGPLGRYFARLQRILVTFDKKDQSPIFHFTHTCLASIPDAASDSAVPDQTWAGTPMRNRQATNVKEGAKYSKSDQWDRVMVQLQAYGVKTKNFGVRDGQEHPELTLQDMADAIDLLNERRPAVVIDVTETDGTGANKGKKYKNCNVREVVGEEVVSRLAKADFTISDEELEIPDDEDDAGSADDEAIPTLEEAESFIKPLTRKERIDALITQGDDVKTSMPYEDHSDEELYQVILAAVMKTEIPQFTRSGNTAVVAKVANDDEEEDDKKPTNDDEEEDDGPDKLIKLQMYIGTMSRDAVKAAIRANGGMKPDDKFKASQTNEFLNQWLFDLKTGKQTPVSVKVPDDIPY